MIKDLKRAIHGLCMVILVQILCWYLWICDTFRDKRNERWF